MIERVLDSTIELFFPEPICSSNMLKHKSLIIVLVFLFWPITLIYLLNVLLPWHILKHLSKSHYFFIFFEICYRRSESMRKFAIHISALFKLIITSWDKLKTMKLSEVAVWLLQTLLEVILLIIN